MNKLNKLLFFSLFLIISAGCYAQVVGKVDRKTKEFSIAPNQKAEFMIFGYQYANDGTQKLICFASNDNVVRANTNCKFGAYFDTDKLTAGDRIVYMGIAGKFAKMNFISPGRSGGIFYIPRSCFAIK